MIPVNESRGVDNVNKVGHKSSRIPGRFIICSVLLVNCLVKVSILVDLVNSTCLCHFRHMHELESDIQHFKSSLIALPPL